MTKTDLEAFDGVPVFRRGDTFFVPLPLNAQTVIPGGCSCKHCKAHPSDTPKWDTLAFSKGSCPWTVHFPELPR